MAGCYRKDSIRITFDCPLRHYQACLSNRNRSIWKKAFNIQKMASQNYLIVFITSERIYSNLQVNSCDLSPLPYQDYILISPSDITNNFHLCSFDLIPYWSTLSCIAVDYFMFVFWSYAKLSCLIYLSVCERGTLTRELERRIQALREMRNF